MELINDDRSWDLAQKMAEQFDSHMMLKSIKAS